MKEAASTWFGGPLILVVMVIGSETRQLRFRGNFSEVAASVREWTFRLIYNNRKSPLSHGGVHFWSTLHHFSKKKILRANPAAIARRFDGDLQNNRKFEYRLDERPILKNIILRAASVRKLFRRSRPDEMQNCVFLINIKMLLIKLLFLRSARAPWRTQADALGRGLGLHRGTDGT